MGLFYFQTFLPLFQSLAQAGKNTDLCQRDHELDDTRSVEHQSSKGHRKVFERYSKDIRKVFERSSKGIRKVLEKNAN